MLILKSLEWDNCFSYGNNNYIEFDKNPLTQLVGTNGAGKTSISLLLQEVLYGKNIKNIKKQDIENNKTDIKGYNITLEFSKDGENYVIELVRKSTLKLRLIKNGVDISSHTALNTYKSISEILGIADFKVFCQLIYQHSTDSLDFLTATDTNRKKFLINLLQLDRYIELHEEFKTFAKNQSSAVDKLEGSISSMETWLDKHKDFDFIKLEPLPTIKVDKSLLEQIIEREKIENNINQINKKIISNNEYIEERSSIDPNLYMENTPSLPKVSSRELYTEIEIINSNIKRHKQNIKKLSAVKDTCPTCGQSINIDEYKKQYNDEINELNNLEEKLTITQAEAMNSKNLETKIKKMESAKSRFEHLSRLIDTTIPIKTHNILEVRAEIATLKKELWKQEAEASKIEQENARIYAHNSKIDVIKEQLEEMRKSLKQAKEEKDREEELLNILDLLKKVFSTNGLVSYKIESSIKELEKEINKYLSELTYFQIYFKLAGEKLNIEVLDDFGNITNISNLSSGEKARVNIATILAIRNTLSSLTSTKINLLFLDEVIGVIDAEGKEKLAEILLKENLNTFIVSHEWQHPLIPKINIVKEHDISRIEYE